MKQGDLVDNTATFAMIMSFAFIQWTLVVHKSRKKQNVAPQLKIILI